MLLSKRRFAELVADAENGVTWSPEDARLVAGYLQRTINIATTKREQIKGAQRALKGTSTRARNHVIHGEPDKALITYRAGIRTTRQWLDGSHPALLLQ